jgi:outer membrane protein W
MKKIILAVVSVSILVAGNSFAIGQSEEVPAIKKTTMQNMYENYIKDRLSIGLNVNHRYLIDSDSGQKGGVSGDGTYLGTIYAMDEVQNYFPSLYGTYKFNKNFSMELGYSKIESETLSTTYKQPEFGVKSDGTVVQTGFTLSVLGLYPTQTKFTPYGGLGIGYYTGDFEETDHWGLGYHNPQHYEESGSTGLSYNGRTKWMTIDDEFAFIFTLGTTYDLPYNLKLDASFQYILLEANAHYYKSNDYGVTVEHNDDGTFPLDQLAFRLGVKYTF